MATSSSCGLPRVRLRPLQQPPLDNITVYNTATHCYLLATDSLQRDFHLLACRKHSLEEATDNSDNNNISAASGSDPDERGGFSTSGTASQQTPFCSLEDLHDYTTYAVYSPTEAASLVEALQREHRSSMHVLHAVALIGAVRFTEGYYFVLVTERRTAGYLGVHRLFEASQVELVSLLLDNEWVAAQMQTQWQSQRGGELEGLSLFSKSSSAAEAPSGNKTAASRRQQTSYRKSSSSATAAAAAYLFQRRSSEELYRQQFLSSLARSSSFFYSHSYDLTNTLQRNMLAGGAEARAEEETNMKEARGDSTSTIARNPDVDSTRCDANTSQEGRPLHPTDKHVPRMQYVWNEYLLEPWRLSEDAQEMGESRRDERSSPQLPFFSTTAAPLYPAAFARWRIYIIHGYITQRTVVLRWPSFHTLLLTLIARVSKASAGVRYLRRGINSDGQVANHVEVEQIVSEESAWNQCFTNGALSSYVQLRGSVPLRWYHPPTASRLLPKPPIVIGPQDAEWSATCLHFQELLRQYGGPILAHDLLKRKEHNARESTLGDAYRLAAQALSAAVFRASAGIADREDNPPNPIEGGIHTAPLRSFDVLQYESTDLHSLGPLAWNTMTAIAEHHFDQVHCFVCRRRQRHAPSPTNADLSFFSFEDRTTAPTPDYTTTESSCPSVAVQLQCGVVRSNCLDCIDRTNLGQFFHGLHALGEQLAGLGLLHHAADLHDSPAVTELLLEMYLAMGDALATQYGGSAQVGAGVLHRGAGWDQLMGVKRLYNNMMGDRDKQEAIKLLLGRTQPHPRRHSRARNTAMRGPGQVLPFALQYPQPDVSSPNASMTASSPNAAAAAAAVEAGASSPSHPNTNALFATSETALVPASSSFFGNVLHAAARWWGEATGGSSAPSAATVEALRTAQHAAAEAEAEPDYYEHVSTGPRLPPVGLLAAWWVEPLKEFAAWYAACGIKVGRCTELEQLQVSCSDKEKGSGEERREGGRAADRSSPLYSSCEPSVVHSTTTRTSTATTRSPPAATINAPTTTDAVLDDAFAQHLLAEDSIAQQRWLLYVARLERHACLTPQPLQQYRGGPGVSTAAAAASASAEADQDATARNNESTSPVVSASLVFHLSVGNGDEGSAPSPVAVAGSILRPSVPNWGTAGTSSSTTSSFVSFSPTLTPSLFIEPWIVLHTTTHILPVDGASLTSITTTKTSVQHKVRSGEGASSMSAALRLLHAWRGEKSGAPPPDLMSRESRKHPVALWIDGPAVVAVMRQLFGAVPSDAAAIVASFSLSSSTLQSATTSAALRGRQGWCCPEEAHDHKAFPRTVKASVFARQQKELEQLACGETLWIASSHHTQTTTAPLMPEAKKSCRGDASLQRSGEERNRAAKRSASPRSPSDSLFDVTGCALEDQQFTAALLGELYGTPGNWGAEEVILALQRLLYPASLSSAVQRVLRRSHVQPPLSGAELLKPYLSQAVKDKDSLRTYWQRRLSAATEETAKKTSQQQQQKSNVTQKTTAASKAESDNLDCAVELLCRLSSILYVAASAAQVPSPFFTLSHRNIAIQTQNLAPPFSKLGNENDVSLTGAHLSDSASLKEEISVAAVTPLLEDEFGDVPAAVRLQLLFPEHSSHSESTRRCWLLCRLLQPLFFSCVLFPCLLHGLLQSIFEEAPQTSSAVPDGPHRTRDRVRYTFALSPQSQAQLRHPQQHRESHSERQQICSQLAAGALPNVGNSSGGRAESLPSLSSSLPVAVAAASATSLTSSNLRAMHIPATLEIKSCCSALELYCRCERFRSCCRRTHDEQKPFYPSATEALQSPYVCCSSAPRVESNEDTADASWRLLWWAVENNLVVPVVRRREQATLEILADETALFCIMDDVPRVALNIERRSRGEVWKPPQQRDLCVDGGFSAIYGVCVASAFPVHRLIRRSTLTDMVALSETLANLGLSAATRLQEFFRDHVQHGWTRKSLKVATFGSDGPNGTNTSHFNVSCSASSAPSAAGGTGTTVTLFGSLGGGGVVTAVKAESSGGTSEAGGSGGGGNVGSSSSAAADESVAVTPADVIAHFTQLAEECLQSIQSVMVALKFMSLDVLADSHALHAYISFFVNIYNAAYVVAWLTNVKDLTSAAATAVNRVRATSLATPRIARSSPTAAARAALRTIDLLSMPTLCNTNFACFMRTYGVVIGHVFVSLGEIKYGILGGNRPPPYRDTPLWSSSLGTAQTASSSRPTELQSQQQRQPDGEIVSNPSAHVDGNLNQNSWKWWSLVPLHMRAEIAESSRLAALRHHPHLQVALSWREVSDLYAQSGAAKKISSAERHGTRSSVAAVSTSLPSPTQKQMNSKTMPSVSPANVFFSSPAGRGSSPSPASTPSHHQKSPPMPKAISAPLYPTTTVFEKQRRRYAELVDVWSADVVRHLPFRICLQLIDTYLPPPLFHLCSAESRDAEGPGGGGVGGLDYGGSIGGAGRRSIPPDTRLRLDVDVERVPWYLQPILNTTPLVHPTLQSSKLGVVYGVARDGDGRARGTLVPQLSPDANGVLLHPGRMWSSPSYYVVGGDSENGEEAIARAFQLLQSLSGSYLGVDGYHGGSKSGTVVQHLCAPLHHEEVLAQLHATETEYRNVLHSIDPHIFAKAQLSLPSTQHQQQRQKGLSPPRADSLAQSVSSPHASPSSRPAFSFASNTSCSVALHNAMKPLLYEWCRMTDQGMESISLLAKPGSQLRVLLKVLHLLEESYASGEAVRQAQLAVREAKEEERLL